MQHTKQIALIVLDGWGHREDPEHNAIARAKTPFFDQLWAEYPHTTLDASEQKVGLPIGTIGNSEIGHMTIGCGKVIDTDLVRISKAIQTGDFAKTPAFLELFDHVRRFDSTLHILGLMSPVGVHSHQEHLHEFLRIAKEAGVHRIAIHAFTDGRDSPPQEAARYIKALEEVIHDLGIGHIASATGRYFAMDRDKNWGRTKKAEDALFESKGELRRGRVPSEAIAELYGDGALDEYLEPLIFLDANGRSYPVQDNDGIFFFNFRTDRPRQLCYRIMERSKGKNVFLATMTEYAPDVESIAAFPPMKIDTTLAAEIAAAGLRQAHIAETEKYAHVTYFFNGGNGELHDKEEHILIDSRKDVKTHDMAPEMRAVEIADAAIASLEKGTEFIVMNFANADVVGHTANVDAIVRAVETVDKQLERIFKALTACGGIAFITADHGNAEVNIDPVTGERHTAHTLNVVPAIITEKGLVLKSGTLADIAPTILALFGIRVPASMTGMRLF